MLKRIAGSGLFLTLTFSLLVACGATTPVSPSPSPAAVAPTAAPDDGRTVVRVAVGDSGAGLIPHQEIIARFEAANPDIRVELQSVTEDYYATLLASLETATPPDIMQIGDDAVPTFVDQGALVSLDTLITGNEYPLDPTIYLPGLLEPGRWAGGQYLLPKDFSPLAVYYNKRIFDEYGVAYPQDGWTWSEFLDTARALTHDRDDDGSTDLWGVQLPGAWPTGFEYWSAAAGGRLVSPEGVGFLGYLDAPQNVEALQFYADLYHRHKVAPIAENLDPFAPGATWFRDGNAAMWMFGRWPQADLLQDPDVELGVVGLPAGDRRTNILLWSGFGITDVSPNKEAAWRFLRFYAGSEGAESWQNWGLPTVRSVAESAGLFDDPIEGVWIGELDHLSPRSYVYLPLWATTADPVLRKLLEQTIRDPNADLISLLYDAALEAQGSLSGGS